MAAVRKKIRKDQLKQQQRRGQEKQQLHTPEFSDCMVCVPNSKIETHPQSLIGLPLYYTCPNRVRELELQELHGFKSTLFNQSNQ